MRRFIALFLSVIMLLSLAACTDTSSGNENVVEDDIVPMPEISLDREGINLIENGDFSKTSPIWGLYLEGGSSAKFSQIDEVGTLTVSNAGSVQHAVQLYYDNFRLYEKGKYELVFTVWATANKQCVARIQQNGGNYTAYCYDTVMITPEPQTFTIPFKMVKTDGNLRLAFNCGVISDESADSFSNLVIYFDDVKINVIDEKNAVVPPDEIISNIRFNQLGYKPDDTKLVYFQCNSEISAYTIRDKNGKVVYSGNASAKTHSEAGNVDVQIGDFSDFTTPGTYYIVADNAGKSYSFTISEDVYAEAFDSLIKMLYLQRCGCKLTKEYAGDFSHDVCHTGSAVIRDTGKKIDVSGGWHDAGDYGRYIVPAAKTVADLLYAYEQNPSVFTDNVGIPESGNNIPDVLDEVRYELDWMFKMQRNDGAVYHKVATKKFCGSISPVKDTAQLYVFNISTTATADYAAAMAIAARVFKSLDPAYAEKRLESARLAWDFLSESTMITFKNPGDTETGAYDDGWDEDERFWAAAALYKTTGEAEYHNAFKNIASKRIYRGKGWADIGTFGVLEYLSLDESMHDSNTYTNIYNDFISYANYLYDIADKEIYGISLAKYPWGSNMQVADNGATLYSAYAVTGDTKYLEKAYMHFNYIYGLNPIGICYVTGTGTRSPLNPHHRMSYVAGEAMPGMVVGGPNQDREDPAAQSLISEGTAPMRCYIDNYDSYSCNEITIYWNSPLIYLMAVLEK